MKKIKLCILATIVAMSVLTACEKTPAVTVTGVTITPPAATLAIGSELTLEAVVMPENADNNTVSWSSNKPDVATVEDGTVKAIAVGVASITATTTDGGKMATCEITVVENDIAVTGITLNKESLELEIGSTAKLTATVEPSDATNSSIVWSSLDNNVVTVDKDGNVKAVAKGETSVTAVAGGIGASCEVKVVSPVEDITINHESITLELGFTAMLTATVQPDDATAVVVWTSSDDSTAIVGQDGTVTGIEEGTALITATAGNKSAKCEVIVTPAKWARSNIVWIEDSSKPDGGYLTFAVKAADNADIPANVQGAYFRWGSLVAVSPVGNYKPSSILHSPSGDKTYEWWTSGGPGWGELPYISDTQHPFGDYVNAADDFAAYNEGTGFDTTTDTGDICRYISSKGWVEGDWRMPTAYDLNLLVTEGMVSAAGSNWGSVTVPDDGHNVNGFYLFESGYFMGHGADMSDNRSNPVQGAIFAPAAGTLHVSSGGLYNVGEYGYLWSGSSAASQFATQLAFYGERAGWPEQIRKYAASVRCIRIIE